MCYGEGGWELPKRGKLRQFADLRRGGGAWQEMGGVFVGGGVDTPVHTMIKYKYY